eukprot:scaffold158039_cov29-Tisochrysis_lutea.AAC.7
MIEAQGANRTASADVRPGSLLCAVHSADAMGAGRPTIPEGRFPDLRKGCGPVASDVQYAEICASRSPMLCVHEKRGREGGGGGVRSMHGHPAPQYVGGCVCERRPRGKVGKRKKRE